jgi:hypothetical protein
MGCPNKYCSSIVPTVELIDLFDKGLAPIDGGVLNQSASFLHAAKFLSTQDRLAKELTSHE